MKINFQRRKEKRIPPAIGSPKAWICNTQLGRRNLTDEERTYTIGKQYEAEKMTQGGDRKSRDAKRLLKPESGPNKTAKAVARQHGIGETTVKQSEKFAKGVDTAEEISPGAKDTPAYSYNGPGFSYDQGKN